GMFNAESAWGTTEELWFNDWEFKGTPYDNREGYVKWSPHQYAKNFKTPTLVIHGQRDYRLDVSEASSFSPRCRWKACHRRCSTSLMKATG
ncbi:MAG TPA: prolyl oligopeptidase family serine peptidase, partial [Bryobacteraceae bacterium]|nr:prolyl oligopeptidase family serine peptidase [Bryobacteraceae bacterium]